jgi:haloalkane dehalogenase
MTEALEERSAQVQVDGLELHYRELGSGPAVLLLHGWPTSSFLWRDVMPPIARESRAIALDLPGFGRSSKPLDSSYSFRFFDRVLDGFLAELEIDELSIAVHDLGGPIGLHWAVHNPERVRKLALLNTVVYPKLSWAVVAFGLACRVPLARSWMSSPSGLAFAMRLGMANRANLTEEVVAGVQEPYRAKDSRKALLQAGIGLHPGGLKEIERRLPALGVPVRVVYGERDRILPDIAKTAERVKRDLPAAEVTALPHCGHFLQEDAPDEVGELLAEFFAG